MVEVGHKPATDRVARASGVLRMSVGLMEAIQAGSLAKGEVLQVARLAGIMASKRTSDLVPLCHGLALSSCEVDFVFDWKLSGIRAQAVCRAVGPTGVEMEALTAVSVALLTLYDMGKAMDKTMRLDAIQLEEKQGGQSGTFLRASP